MRRALAVLAVSALTQAPAAAAWTWPVDGPVLRPFVLGSDPYAAGQHRGIDIGASPGTQVQAAAGGTVSFTGSVPAGGRAITVRTVGGLSVTYLELGTIGVPRGTVVGEGDTIGTIGSAAHVHFGVRETAEAQGYLDPLRFLPAKPAQAPGAAEPEEPSLVPVAEPEPVVVEDARQSPGAAHPAPARPEDAPAASAPITPDEASPAPAEAVSAPLTARASPTAVENHGEPRPTAKLVPTAAAKPLHEREAPPVDRDAGPARSLELRSQVVPSRPRVVRRARNHTTRRSVTRETSAPPLVTSEADRAIEVDRHAVEPAFRRRASAHDDDRNLAPLLLFGSALLAAAGAIVTGLRKRPAGAQAPMWSSVPCSRTILQPPRLLHGCVRAGADGWFAPTVRSRVLLAAQRPLPRTRRREPIELRG